MVVAFGVCGVGEDGGSLLLHSSVYGFLSCTGATDLEQADHFRDERRNAMQAMADRVQSETNFQEVAAETEATSWYGCFSSKLLATRDGSLIVHWRRNERIAFFLAIRRHENPEMTQLTLQAMIQKYLSLCPSTSKEPCDAMKQPDILCAIEHVYLPNGIINIGHQTVFAQLGKEVDQLLVK
eukprot:m.175582 g.175582  ORF g.175582 m.175582 type:complete len:182 (-) comp15431_c0_seq1:200-745(-)